MIHKEPLLENICLDSWIDPLFQYEGLEVEVLRLDKIHPEISGNKWFKLKYYLEEARFAGKKKLISFGGAYSNHLLALASAAALRGFTSAGIVRGEKPEIMSPVLLAAKELGMELHFFSRPEYNIKKKSVAIKSLHEEDPDAFFIPEGGAGRPGIRGASEILSTIPINNYSHICCAVGTGTTLAGLIKNAVPQQKMIGISVLKGTTGIEPLDISWVKNKSDLKNVSMIHEDHFGGYAKNNQVLFDFMNSLFFRTGIPTDFVYTGKLFYSIMRLAGLHYFEKGSRILILHTGGLYGNHSLAPGILQF